MVRLFIEGVTGSETNVRLKKIFEFGRVIPPSGALHIWVEIFLDSIFWLEMSLLVVQSNSSSF